jgi:hypothetical protein
MLKNLKLHAFLVGTGVVVAALVYYHVSFVKTQRELQRNQDYIQYMTTVVEVKSQQITSLERQLAVTEELIIADKARVEQLIKDSAELNEKLLKDRGRVQEIVIVERARRVPAQVEIEVNDLTNEVFTNLNEKSALFYQELQ